jgi:hypothetical protein
MRCLHGADFRELLGRRIPQAVARIDAANLDVAQLRVRELAPWTHDAARILSRSQTAIFSMSARVNSV